MKTLETIAIPRRNESSPLIGSAAAELIDEPVTRIPFQRARAAHQSVGFIGVQSVGAEHYIPAKFIYSKSPFATQEGIWFGASLEDVGYPGVTAATLSDWPKLWQHPEASFAFHTINTLIVGGGRAILADSECWESMYQWVSADPQSARERFLKLAAIWKRETAVLSDTIEIVTHPSYQQIIGMGAFALPHIFHELDNEPSHWFHALVAITRTDPVPEEEKGNIPAMRQRWLEWA